jgi:hypothetical protein
VAVSLLIPRESARFHRPAPNAFLAQALHLSAIVIQRSTQEPDLNDASAGELLENAFRQTADLVRAEASLATAELKTELISAVVAVAATTAALALATLAIAFLAAAVLFALGAGIAVLLAGTGGILAALAVTAWLVASKALPKKVLPHTRERVSAEIHRIEDHAT